jgi:hypothetical protein
LVKIFVPNGIRLFSGKRRGVTRQSVIDMGFRPIPGQKFIESAHGVAVRHALKDAFEIGERSTSLSLAVAMREQTVAHRAPPPSEPAILAPERDGPNRRLDRIVVEIDTAIIQETAKG